MKIFGLHCASSRSAEFFQDMTKATESGFRAEALHVIRVMAHFKGSNFSAAPISKISEFQIVEATAFTSVSQPWTGSGRAWRTSRRLENFQGEKYNLGDFKKASSCAWHVSRRSWRRTFSSPTAVVRASYEWLPATCRDKSVTRCGIRIQQLNRRGAGLPRVQGGCLKGLDLDAEKEV